jgi:hypothetical protein
VSTPGCVELEENIGMLFNKGGEVGVVEDYYLADGEYGQKEEDDDAFW